MRAPEVIGEAPEAGEVGSGHRVRGLELDRPDLSHFSSTMKSTSAPFSVRKVRNPDRYVNCRRSVEELLAHQVLEQRSDAIARTSKFQAAHSKRRHRRRTASGAAPTGGLLLLANDSTRRTSKVSSSTSTHRTTELLGACAACASLLSREIDRTIRLPPS